MKSNERRQIPAGPADSRRPWQKAHAPSAARYRCWLLASAAFSQFLARVANFNATYGSFAAAVVLIVWLWLTNVALFFGAEVNVELDRERHSRREPATEQGS